MSNIKILMQKVGIDPEQNLMGNFAKSKINSEFYTDYKGRINCEYWDTYDMEWAI